MDENETTKSASQEKRLMRKEKKEELRGSNERRSIIKKVVSWMATFIIIGGAVFGAVYIGSNSADDGDQTASVINVVTVKQGDWMIGSTTAPVTLIEYSDFQCPACKLYDPILRKLIEDYGDKVSLIYRHFPLSQHQQAKPTAYAAEAAGRQGKFWEMHDIIFDKQNEWADRPSVNSKLENYAKGLGLNMEKFKADFSDSAIKTKVEADFKSGIEAEVNATPTFFLNGVKIDAPRSLEEFKNKIDGAISS